MFISRAFPHMPINNAKYAGGAVRSRVPENVHKHCREPVKADST